MTHDIPEYMPNSAINHCINEYVRLERDREILREHWFGGKSMMKLSEDYDLSLTQIQKIIHKIGDKVLLMAEKRREEK